MFLLAKASVFLTAVWGSTCVAHDGHVDDSKIHFHEIETKLKVAVSDFSATYFEGSVEGPLAETRSERSIVLLGGCSDPYGNIYISDADYPGFYCNQLTKSAYAFHPDDQTISRLPDMPEERTRHTAAFVDGRLYVIGGRGNQDELVKDVIVFDPELQQWNTFITLDDDHATSDHGTVARGGKIYVFGGWKANYESPKNETFSIDTRSNGKIEDLKPMMSQRGDIAAVHYKHGHIDAAFVIGGFGEEYCKPVATVERYFFDSNFWSESSNENLDLGVARGDKVAAVMDAKILVVAGEDKHEDLCDTPDLQPSVQAQAVDTVEVLDPLSKTPKWEVHPDFPVERFRSASAIDEKTNTLYVFGGQKSHNIDCDCYKTADEIYSYQGEQKKGGLSKAATGLIVTACVLLVAGVGFFYFRRTKRA